MMALSSEKQKPQILIKRTYAHNIQKIWEAITTKEALSEWLMETQDFSLQQDAKFQFRTKPQGNFDGIIDCQVLSIDPPNTFVYSWNNASFKKSTTVQWQLRALNDHETMLTLSHSGFEGFSGWITKQILRSGWKKLLSKKLLNYLQA